MDALAQKAAELLQKYQQELGKWNGMRAFLFVLAQPTVKRQSIMGDYDAELCSWIQETLEGRPVGVLTPAFIDAHAQGWADVFLNLEKGLGRKNQRLVVIKPP